MIETKLIQNSLKSEKSTEMVEEKPFKTEIVWKNVAIFIVLHYIAILTFFHWRWDGFLFHLFYGLFSGFGIVAGAHRLWAHRAFKANFKLQVLLMILQSICMENDIIEWVRDHRVHHKYSDTNADPTNSNRGFFFSHIGWLMCKKHPDVKKFGKKIDMSDIESDPLLQFQRKYYIPLVLIFAFTIPILVTMYGINASFSVSFYAAICRYVISLHIVWLTNSVAHIGSWKPYDKNIASADSKLYGTICYGEGWHNFHHTFPWDYKVSEQTKWRHNFGMCFIDFFAWIGWATDLKIASEDMIRKRVMRTGDGSHPYAVEAAKIKKKFDEDYINNNHSEIIPNGVETYWGMGDSDIPDEDIRDIKTVN